VATRQSNYVTVGYRTADCLAVLAGWENWGCLDPFHTSAEASRNFQLFVTGPVCCPGRCAPALSQTLAVERLPTITPKARRRQYPRTRELWRGEYHHS
jgi:hypothetical protein